MIPLREWRAGGIAAIWLLWASALISTIAATGRHYGGYGLAQRLERTFVRHPKAWNPLPSLSDSQAVLLYYFFRLTPEGLSPDSARTAALSALMADTVPAHRDSTWRAMSLPARLTPAQRESLPAMLLAPLGRDAGPARDTIQAFGAWFWLAVLGFLATFTGLTVMTLRWYVPRAVAAAAEREKATDAFTS